MRATALAVIASLSLGSAWAQSLGEHAAREREKKDTQVARPRPRVFTDDDLKKPRPTGEGESAEAAPSPTPAPDSTTFTSEAEAREEERKGWQARAARTREDLAVARAAVGEVQGRLDRLKSPHHQLFPFGLGNPEVPVVEELLAQAKQRLADAERARAELERDAVQDRVPSRWIQDQ